MNACIKMNLPKSHQKQYDDLFSLLHFCTYTFSNQIQPVMKKVINTTLSGLLPFLFATQILIPNAGHAQTGEQYKGPTIDMESRIDDLDAWVAEMMAREQIPGLSLVVVQNGNIVKAGHYGLANVELNVPVNEETSFKIASMSKAFTAAALMLLVEDGSVGLDDRVTSHLEGLPSTWDDITLRQLANHTSGMSNDWDLHPGGPRPDDWTNNSSDYFLQNTTDEAFLSALTGLPLLFAPGERSSYAAGTFVIGMVIERVSGMPYAEFMRTRIFEPLGMTRTIINDAARVVPHRASGYRLHRGELMNGWRISQAAEARGDVGVMTTALDMAKWDAAMRDTRLLSQASLDEIATPARLNDGGSYPDGLGWSLWPIRGFHTMGHGGGFRTGFSSIIYRFMDGDLTVIIVSNLWNVVFTFTDAQEIASFFDPTFQRISTMLPRTDPDPDRSNILRNVIGLVASGIVNPTYMTENFLIDAYNLTPWQERHEGLESFSFVDCQPRGSRGVASDGSVVSEVCFYSFTEPQGTGYLVFSLTDDGRVADLYAEEFKAHPTDSM